MPINLVNTPEQVDDTLDGIVIPKYFDGLTSGAGLVVPPTFPDTIPAGTVIIYDSVNKSYKPMVLNEAGTAYGALPENHTYVGVLGASISKRRPFAAVMTNGRVALKAAPFGLATSSILAAVKTALPLVAFR